jgi:DNA-binding MarR family transcriptional regulator
MRDTQIRDLRLKDSVPHLVGILFRHVSRIHTLAVRPFALSAVHANVLASLFVEGTTIVSELQKRLGMSSSTMTATLDRMEKAELIKRIDVVNDRRMAQVVPPQWPAKKRDELLDALADTEELCFASLTVAEHRELVRLLKKAIGAIEKVRPRDLEG